MSFFFMGGERRERTKKLTLFLLSFSFQNTRHKTQEKLRNAYSDIDDRIEGVV